MYTKRMCNVRASGDLNIRGKEPWGGNRKLQGITGHPTY